MTVIDGPGVIVIAEQLKAYGKIALAAGQSVLAGRDGGKISQLTDERLRSITAWQSDEMLFTGQTLATVVEEYNRYLPRKIVIRDPALAQLRLGGRFNVHDPVGFLKALKESFGVQSVDDGKVISLTK